MSVSETSYPVPDVRPTTWGVLVIGLGVGFGLVEIAHLREMNSLLGVVLEAFLPLIGAIGLVVAGYALWQGRVVSDAGDTPRVVAWTVGGVLGMVVVFLWIFAHQLIRGGSFHHAHFLLVNNCILGGVLGFIVGGYDARSRTYRRSVHRERLKQEFISRELRHHVLNGMQVVLSQFDRLEREAAPEQRAAISAGRSRAEEIVSRVQSVRTINQVFTEAGEVSLSRQDASAVLRDAVADADDRYEDAVIDADIPGGVTVSADRYLSAVFENLLSNAVEHNDADDPRVDVSLTVTDDTALVRIADNGPGLSDEHKASLFRWEEPSRAEIGMGVGLAIVTALVDRYDGRVQVADNDPTGTVVSVELRRA